MKYTELELRGNVAILWMDRKNEKVNTLNQDLLAEFESHIQKFETDDAISSVVFISKKPDTFIAGADLDVIRDSDDRAFIEKFNRDGNILLERIAHLKKPVIAAIHGATLGGGLEVALACHFRIATDHPKTVFALPEVKLGLLPGAGGTQRLPKLVGLQKALDMALTGKNIYAYPAKKMGLIDMLVHKDALLEVALERAEYFSKKGIKRKDRKAGMVNGFLDNTSIGRSIVYSQAKKTVMRQTKGNYPAPLKILDSMKAGMEKGVKAGREAETMGFVDLVFTSESRALVNLFFGMTDAKKNPKAELVKPIKRIGVLGAGLMGSGIADVSANKDYRVILKDRDLESAGRGLKSIADGMKKKVSKKIMKSFERDQILSRITPAADNTHFGGVDMVIEAVFEDLNLKKKIVAEMEAVLPEHAIFASNTSSLPIKDIAEGAKRPGQILGMHYFSPVQKMPLLEIIKTDQTEDWVVATAYEVGAKQGKTVIVVNDGPGFYTTRILAPFMNEALVLLEEGAEIEQIDSAMKKFGYPVGPMVLFDEVGIDVGAHINDVMGDFFAQRGFVPTDVTKKLYEAGFYGRKSKKGFFLYQDGKKKKEVNTDIYKFFGGSNRKKFDTQEIQFRISAMMINEAVRCLEEGILLSPTDGDLGAILGLGFPPFLGGPFRYIDTLGADKIVDRFNKLAEKHGKQFTPAQMLVDMAKSGKKFF